MIAFTGLTRPWTNTVTSLPLNIATAYYTIGKQDDKFNTNNAHREKMTLS